MWRVSHEQLVRETWAALSRDDFGPLETALAPGAKWRAVEDGPWNCENRSQIVEVLAANRAAGLDGEVEQVVEAGDRAIVAFRPARESPGQWPLDHGVRYLVLTFDGAGLVSEMKGCADRATAFAYAGATS
jgi:ketosteroid isomerase-like protein